MKYDSLRKLDRNNAIRKLHKESPELSYAEIGAIFSISRQRVGQILEVKDESKQS